MEGVKEMSKESKRESNSKYRSANTKQLVARFFPSDMDVYEYAISQENTTQYIKNLIRADMEKQQQ
jgi:hypothetical protein